MTAVEQAMTELFDALVDAYTAKDLEKAIEVFAGDATLVGTGGDEVRFGRDEVAVQVEPTCRKPIR